MWAEGLTFFGLQGEGFRNKRPFSNHSDLKKKPEGWQRPQYKKKRALLNDERT